jgi:hypothetical protein
MENRTTNFIYTNQYSDINLKEIFTEDELKIISKYLADEEVKEKLTQKKIINEIKKSNGHRKSYHMYDKTDFIFKLIKICSQKFKQSKDTPLSKGLEW